MSIQTSIDRIKAMIAATYEVLAGFGADIPTDANANNLPETAASIKSPSAYEGSYTITPSAETQTLQTADKRMAKNVEVKAIPYREEINETGGTIVYIACENVPSEEGDTTSELGKAVLGKMKLSGNGASSGEDDTTAELGEAVIGEMKLA